MKRWNVFFRSLLLLIAIASAVPLVDADVINFVQNRIPIPFFSKSFDAGASATAMKGCGCSSSPSCMFNGSAYVGFGAAALGPNTLSACAIYQSIFSSTPSGYQPSFLQYSIDQVTAATGVTPGGGFTARIVFQLLTPAVSVSTLLHIASSNCDTTNSLLLNIDSAAVSTSDVVNLHKSPGENNLLIRATTNGRDCSMSRDGCVLDLPGIVVAPVWMDLFLVFDNTGMARVYINATEHGRAYGYRLTLPSSYVVSIGSMVCGTTSPNNINVRSIELWNSPLSEQSIRDISFNAQLDLLSSYTDNYRNEFNGGNWFSQNDNQASLVVAAPPYQSNVQSPVSPESLSISFANYMDNIRPDPINLNQTTYLNGSANYVMDALHSPNIHAVVFPPPPSSSSSSSSSYPTSSPSFVNISSATWSPTMGGASTFVVKFKLDPMYATSFENVLVWACSAQNNHVERNRIELSLPAPNLVSFRVFQGDHSVSALVSNNITAASQPDIALGWYLITVVINYDRTAYMYNHGVLIGQGFLNIPFVATRTSCIIGGDTGLPSFLNSSLPTSCARRVGGLCPWYPFIGGVRKLSYYLRVMSASELTQFTFRNSSVAETFDSDWSTYSQQFRSRYLPPEQNIQASVLRAGAFWARIPSVTDPTPFSVVSVSTPADNSSSSSSSSFSSSPAQQSLTTSMSNDGTVTPVVNQFQGGIFCVQGGYMNVGTMNFCGPSFTFREQVMLLNQLVEGGALFHSTNRLGTPFYDFTVGIGTVYGNVSADLVITVIENGFVCTNQTSCKLVVPGALRLRRMIDISIVFNSGNTIVYLDCIQVASSTTLLAPSAVKRSWNLLGHAYSNSVFQQYPFGAGAQDGTSADLWNNPPQPGLWFDNADPIPIQQQLNAARSNLTLLQQVNVTATAFNPPALTNLSSQLLTLNTTLNTTLQFETVFDYARQILPSLFSLFQPSRSEFKSVCEMASDSWQQCTSQLASDANLTKAISDLLRSMLNSTNNNTATPTLNGTNYTATPTLSPAQAQLLQNLTAEQQQNWGSAASTCYRFALSLPVCGRAFAFNVQSAFGQQQAALASTVASLSRQLAMAQTPAYVDLGPFYLGGKFSLRLRGRVGIVAPSVVVVFSVTDDDTTNALEVGVVGPPSAVRLVITVRRGYNLYQSFTTAAIDCSVNWFDVWVVMDEDGNIRVFNWGQLISYGQLWLPIPGLRSHAYLGATVSVNTTSNNTALKFAQNTAMQVVQFVPTVQMASDLAALYQYDYPHILNSGTAGVKYTINTTIPGLSRGTFVWRAPGSSLWWPMLNVLAFMDDAANPRLLTPAPGDDCTGSIDMSDSDTENKEYGSSSSSWMGTNWWSHEIGHRHEDACVDFNDQLGKNVYDIGEPMCQTNFFQFQNNGGVEPCSAVSDVDLASAMTEAMSDANSYTDEQYGAQGTSFVSVISYFEPTLLTFDATRNTLTRTEMADVDAAMASVGELSFMYNHPNQNFRDTNDADIPTMPPGVFTLKDTLPGGALNDFLRDINLHSSQVPLYEVKYPLWAASTAIMSIAPPIIDFQYSGQVKPTNASVGNFTALDAVFPDRFATEPGKAKNFTLMANERIVSVTHVCNWRFEFATSLGRLLTIGNFNFLNRLTQCWMPVAADGVVPLADNPEFPSLTAFNNYNSSRLSSSAMNVADTAAVLNGGERYSLPFSNAPWGFKGQGLLVPATDPATIDKFAAGFVENLSPYEPWTISPAERITETIPGYSLEYAEGSQRGMFWWQFHWTQTAVSYQMYNVQFDFDASSSLTSAQPSQAISLDMYNHGPIEQTSWMTHSLSVTQEVSFTNTNTNDMSWNKGVSLTVEYGFNEGIGGGKLPVSLGASQQATTTTSSDSGGSVSLSTSYGSSNSTTQDDTQMLMANVPAKSKITANLLAFTGAMDIPYTADTIVTFINGQTQHVRARGVFSNVRTTNIIVTYSEAQPLDGTSPTTAAAASGSPIRYAP